MPAPCPTHQKEVVAGPIKAMIEVVRGCNLRCPTCPVGNGLARQWPNMPFGLYTRIIDKCCQTLKQLSLFNYGEPLLCRDIDQYVMYAKQSGIERVIIHTNGLFLSKQMGQKLIDAGLDRLTVSIDAADSKTYVKYRVGGNFRTLLKNIKRFIVIRNQAGKALPQVEGQIIVMSHNEHQTSELVVICRQLGVDVTSIKTYNGRMSLNQDKQHNFLEPHNRAMSRLPGGFNYDEMVRNLRGCSWPRSILSVNADGTIVPCGYDYNNWNPIGNFKNTLQTEYWHTRERYELVDRLERNPLSISLCRNCPKGTISLAKVKT